MLDSGFSCDFIPDAGDEVPSSTLCPDRQLVHNDSTVFSFETSFPLYVSLTGKRGIGVAGGQNERGPE